MTEQSRTANSAWTNPAPIIDNLVDRLRHVASANNEASLCHPSLLTGAADEIEDLRSLLRAVLDGWDADVEATTDFGGHALVMHPGGCISARRRISDQQVDVFRRVYENGRNASGGES